MYQNPMIMTLETLNNIRAISAINKEDLERIATRLNLDSSIQLNILWIVYCNEGVRITTIAEWTFWHTSSIVIHVKKMMEKGYVSIEKSDLDGRVVNVYLTEQGRERIKRYYEMIPSAFHITKALDAMSKKYSPTITMLFRELLEFVSMELQGEEKIHWFKENVHKIKELEDEIILAQNK